MGTVVLMATKNRQKFANYNNKNKYEKNYKYNEDTITYRQKEHAF